MQKMENGNYIKDIKELDEKLEKFKDKNKEIGSTIFEVELCHGKIICYGEKAFRRN